MMYPLFRWANIVLVVFTLVVYWFSGTNPERFWGFALLTPTFPWLLLLHLLFIAGWLLLRKPYFLFSFCCILLGWGQLTAFIGWHGSAAATPQETSLRVLTYNVFMLRALPRPQGTERGKEDEAFFAFIRQQEPLDVLCTQESSKSVSNSIAAGCHFPNVYFGKGKGTTIYSRHPFLDKGSVEFPGSENSCIWVDLQIGDRKVRVYNVHLQSNHISDEANRLAEEGDLQERETWRGIRGMMAKFKRAAVMRADQVQRVVEHLSTSPHPVIVCGDLNDTPLSYSYRHLTADAGLIDVFKERGAGLGTTYAGVLPALRIDYILADPRIRALDYRILRRSFSDHYPVIGELALP